VGVVACSDVMRGGGDDEDGKPTGRGILMVVMMIDCL
jgi:hypothetical protein